MSTPPAPPPAAVADALEATYGDAVAELVTCGLSPDEAAALVLILVYAISFDARPELRRRERHTWVKVERDPSVRTSPDATMSLHVVGLNDTQHAELERTVAVVLAGLAGEAA